MSYFRSKYLLAARALVAKDWSHPTVIRAARHMAHDGATLREIMTALGWDINVRTANLRLKKFNIRPRNWANRAHRGEITGLPFSENGFDLRNYKPREVNQ